MDRINVLIVEDDAAIGNMIRLALGHEAPHFDIETVCSARECLDRLEVRDADCIMSDYQMHGMDGMELLKRLRTSGNSVPFIFLTAQGNEELAREAFKNGAYDYFTKKIGFAHFPRIVNSIEQAVRQRQSEAAKLRVEKELRKLSRAVEQSPNMVTIASPNCVVEYVNPRFTELTGYAPEEVIGTDANGFREQDSRECGLMHDAIGTGHDWKGEFRLRRKDGGFLWVSASISSIKDAEGEITHYICIQQDITERKCAEEEMARLAAAVEAIAEAVYVTDTRGGILYVNPAFERITGYSREEAVGRTIELLNTESQDGSLFPGMSEALSAGEVWSGVYTCARKDGTLREIEGTISSVRGPSGEIFNYVAVMKDVTDKRRLESIAESVNSMNNLGYVFAGVRHEVGGPVNALKMTLSILNSNIKEYSRETIGESIGRCLEEIGRVEYLLHSLKSFNMYESPDLDSVSIGSFMEKFLAIARGDFGRRGIVVSAVMEADGCHVRIDPRALQQVMLNVLANAADALAGRLSPAVSIKVFKRDRMVVIKVEDNGVGMTPDQMSSLFKPFYTSKPSGTGLGLVIAKKMLSKMDATIEITSRLGEGTVVEITLPGEAVHDA